ncbi:MAG TPA: AAA family ATPase [Actinomycetota bacterium]|nr:AAA family ATPase [Actinomycetota bacterium]
MSDIEFAPDMPTFAHSSVTIEEFVARPVAIPEPLIGGADTRLLPAASTAVFYGEGGSGKTTLTIDLALHLAAGVEWLGFEIAKPVRVMLLENEGPIDEYQLKLDRKLLSWNGPKPDGRLRVHDRPWGRVDLRADVAVEGLAKQIRLHEIDVLIAGPVRRLGLEGGGTPAETVAYMQLLDRVRHLAGRRVAIVNVHHENKGGDISGAFEAEFDTVVHVRADGRDRTRLVFRKSRWSSKIHRARMTLSWVRDSEGFAIIESDLDGPQPNERNEEEAAALDWLTAYIAAHPGVARGKAETAYHDAHAGGRNLARRIINSQIALATQVAESSDPDGDRRNLLRFATGPGETKRGTYLYPLSHAVSPLAATLSGETGETLATPGSIGVLATSPPPIEEAAAGETRGEGDEIDYDELDRLFREHADIAEGRP